MAGPPSPSCFAPIKSESPNRFVSHALGIKPWMDAMPSCAQARPGSCPCCKAAAQPTGKPIVVVGHGVVDRQVLGPGSPGGRPERLMVKVRRYRCRSCDAVVMVGPSGLVRGRWYHGGAIATAMSAFASGESTATARVRTSPSAVVGSAASDRWVTITRWLDAARRGDLFGVRDLGALDRREVAEHVVLALAARGGHVLGGDRGASAFAGAMIAA